MKKNNLIFFGLWAGFIGFSLMLLIDFIAEDKPLLNVVIQIALVAWSIYNTRKWYLTLRRKNGKQNKGI